MVENDDNRGTCNLGDKTKLFSNSEVGALEQELTALHDVTGAIHAAEHSCATIEPAWHRKTAIIAKLRKENRRVLECSAKLDELKRWRDLRARTKAGRAIKEADLVS
jgi:hypothetical protein